MASRFGPNTRWERTGSGYARGRGIAVTRAPWLVLALAVAPGLVHAEGSFQVGLTQALYDYDGRNSASINPIDRPIFVDIVAPGEVINISLCGSQDSDALRIEIYDAFFGFDPIPNTGTLLFSQNLTSGNIACNRDMSTPIATPVRFVTPASGTYELRLFNTSQSDQNSTVFERYDITVTPTDQIDPDPTAVQGRVFAPSWAFNAGGFGIETNADFFVKVPGGFPNTNFVWKLDLNEFAGFGYEIIANAIGVDPPNSGRSVPVAGNNASPEYPIYLNYPEVVAPEPIQTAIIRNFRFVDDEGIDRGISPGSTIGVQDEGTFSFETNVDGTYAITIDVDGDTVIDQDDVLLLGTTTADVPISVPWNGQTNAGDILPNGDYQANLEVRVGEYHFVARDVEDSGTGFDDGLTIERATSQANSVSINVLFDDSALGGGSNLPVGQLGARHTWNEPIGNENYVDTYVFGTARSDSTQASIVSTEVALRLTKADSADPVAEGDTFDYILTVNNDGPDPESNVQLSDILPSAVSVLSIQSSQGSCSETAGTVECALGALAAGNSATVTITVRADELATVTNTATVTGDEADVDQANNQASETTRIIEPPLSGRVFNDNGAGTGTAHDGLVNGTEQGLARVIVRLVSGASCTGPELDRSETDSLGHYSLSLGVASPTEVSVCVEPPLANLTISENTGSTGASNPVTTDGRVTFTAAPDTRYTDVDFGLVTAPRFIADNERTALPGSVVFLPHTFESATAGGVTFDTVNAVATPELAGWTSTIFEDANCNAQLDTGESALGGEVILGAEPGDPNVLCILNRVTVPTAAGPGAQYQSEPRATYRYLATGETTILTVTDLVQVLGQEAGTLVLEKRVDKPVAEPGELLTYTLVYRNTGVGPINDLTVDDATPAFTRFVAACCDATAGACCAQAAPTTDCTPGGTLAPDLTACRINHPGTGNTGAVTWRFDGTLRAGQSGELRYQVRIEQ